ncbi:YceI family protein [Sphingomonas sp. C3-2]|uniref:YceI family protein n=1 Tax=Sphingomonas sp. C3-2 TaxID=3062169 RepID=UPI00294AFCA8|nr:YceI family protein [Sphingomonas sp. C3-2]WOK36864.1 YceI family protein [Sphingomonas sp. C3-2]
MRRSIIAIALAATAAVALPVIAQQNAPMTAPGARDASRITGGTYKVDPGHTLVQWTVDHLGFTPYFGIFGDVTGTLVLDPKNPAAAKVDVTIPVAKVTTASTGLTKHLLTKDFFGDAPADARFVSTSVRVDDDGDEAKIAGNLTLNGVTKPVTLDADFYGAGKMPAQMGGKENVGFEAEATIRRSDFGINYGLPMVSDTVKLKIVAAFEK